MALQAETTSRSDGEIIEKALIKRDKVKLHGMAKPSQLVSAKTIHFLSRNLLSTYNVSGSIESKNVRQLFCAAGLIF